MGGVYGVLRAILRATAGSRGHERLPSPQATSSRRARARILSWSLDGLQSLCAWCGLAQQSDCVDRAAFQFWAKRDSALVTGRSVEEGDQ